MGLIIRGIKLIFNFILFTILILIAIVIFSSIGNITDSNGKTKELVRVESFKLEEKTITYNCKNDNSNQDSKQNIASSSSENQITNQTSNVKINAKVNNEVDINNKIVLDRAQAMVDVKWVPKYNLTSKYGPYIFVKGKTYTGIPYSMDFYQVKTVDDFLSKISDSKIIYGNDCSGFVSAAWRISRQTTLDFYEAVKEKKKIDGKSVVEIPWEDLRPGDALLLDNGKGKGHIILYISTDVKDIDKLNVYEQNVPTIKPFEPLPVARKAVRSKDSLRKSGYFPIRLIG